MQLNSNIAIKYGIVAAIVCILVLFIRNTFLVDKQLWFFVVRFLTFVFLIIIFVKTGISRRKQLGGIAEIKELFQAVFIVILFAAVSYNLMNYLYLNFINPGFVKQYSEAYIDVLKNISENAGQVQVEKIEEITETIRDNAKSPENYSVKTHLQATATWIILYSIIGLIISAVLRKKANSVEF